MSSILVHNKNSKKLDDYKAEGFYPTPWEATEAAMLAERPWIEHFEDFDEPACGDGAMAEVIRSHGKTVNATDLVYRGYGTGGVDFLSPKFKPTSKRLFTNPPFSDDDKNPLAEPFIRQAHNLGYDYIGMILKANYWNTKNRISLFREHKPVRVRPYSWRIDFTGDGNNHFDCIFVVWMPQFSSRCEFCDPMEKPKVRHQIPLF